MMAATILRDLDSFDSIILVDDDVDFTVGNVQSMLDDLERQADRRRLDGVTPDVPLLGWYRIRSTDGSDLRLSIKRSVKGAYWLGGLGFCGMTREAFHVIHSPSESDWVCVRESLPLIRGVYRSGPDGHWWMSEDLSFCQEAKPQLSVNTAVEHAGFFPSPDCRLLDGSELPSDVAGVTVELLKGRLVGGGESRSSRKNALKRARKATAR